MSQFIFGSGNLFGTRTDQSNSTPVEFAAMQEVAIDFSFSTKELYGQKQFPLAIGRGEGKITGKAKFAQIRARAYNDLFFGSTMATGETLTAYHEAGTVPAATTYTVTVANAATFKNDLGVMYAATGLPMSLVSTAPAIGQYSVDTATGVYTFAAADASAAVLISYTYSSATGGQIITINNQLLGTTPTFRSVFYETFNGQQLTMTLNQCTSSKFALQTKLSDFTVPEMDFSAFADAAGIVGTLSIAEVS
jgi:hypothetical protein